jgi:HK97 family phage prohead protease
MQNTVKVAGYACFFDYVDANNDIILHSAFQPHHALSNRLLDPTEVKFLYQHDITRPIGQWTVLNADSIGLYVEGYLNRDLIDGKHASIMTRDKLINGLSIGYQPIQSFQDDLGHRILEKINLLEISLVTFPMQKNAYLYECIANTNANFTLY